MRVMLSYNQEDQDRLWINNISSLDIIVDNGEASEIVVDDILYSFNIKEIPNIIGLIASKIKKGGKLILYFTDIELLSHMLTMGSINLDDFNEAICPTGVSIKCFLNTDIVLQELKAAGFKINQKQIKNFTSVIVSTLE